MALGCLGFFVFIGLLGAWMCKILDVQDHWYLRG